MTTESAGQIWEFKRKNAELAHRVWLVYRRGLLGGGRPPIHLKADSEGMKKYSPPRSTLNVGMS